MEAAMNETRRPGERWTRSTRCAINDCVEVMQTETGEVLLRNSRRPGAFLRFTREEWAGFVDGVERGDLVV
jgi:hypothetical protein